MDHCLSAHELRKQYKNRVVVDSVSVEVRSGEVVGLLGPNGAGKTTCFYMIVGLVKSDRGKVTLDKLDITRFPMHVRARYGLSYLPQEASVFRKLSVEDNIMAILQTLPKLSRSDRKTRLDQIIEKLNIGHVRKSLGMSLSGGERRRVEIARALATEPKFLLLDEPFAGVDPISVLDIQKIIEFLCDHGIGVLITDHNVRETLGICKRAYIVSGGRVLSSGTPDEVLADHDVRKVYLGEDFKM